MRAILLLMSMVLLTSACSLFPDKEDETKNWSAERIYNEGKSAMDSGYYTEAVKFYEKLQVRYPFGVYARQSQLDLAYSYYKTEDWASAIAASDRFIKLNPTNPHVDYAYYLKGLVSYNEGKGLLQKYLPNDPSQRDPGGALHAFQDFTELVKRFPNSKYVPDAQKRMTWLRNILAEHEVNVAKYYMRRKAYIAAANRCRYVVEHYQGAPAMPDALVIMAKAYKVLDLPDLSNDALRVLELNFPNNPGIEEVRSIVVK